MDWKKDPQKRESARAAARRLVERERSTRERVKELVAADPSLTLAQLADATGVSRERVRQIVASEGLSPKSGWPGVGERAAGAAGAPASRLMTGGVPVRVSHTIVGTIGELLAGADLMARGFMVFFPLTRTGQCDLIALDRDGRCERIEVRCGHRSGKRIAWQQPDRSKSDRRAIVLTGEPVRYEPPFPGDAG